METLDYRFTGTQAVHFPTDAVLVGVLASGNLEILLEPAALDGAMAVRIITAARGFGDEIDAAARVLDPVIAPIRARQHADSTGGPAPPPPPSGVFLKDFVKCEW